jgi:mannose-6-phosphate isomerase-like protein (cupin superfamily)
MVSTVRSRCRFGDEGPSRRDGCRSLDEEKIETDSEIICVNAINLAGKLATFSEHYQPRTVAQFNGHDVMVVKVKGPFTWHKHDETDDFFLVLKGRITIQMREGNVSLGAGEMFVVPRGVEHCPVADEEAHLLLDKWRQSSGIP